MFRLRQRSSAVTVIVVLVLLRRLLLKLCLIVVDIIFFVLEAHNLSSSSVDRQVDYNWRPIAYITAAS